MSPEAFLARGADRSDVREIVEQFYDAVDRKDAEALAELFDESVAPDAVFRWPESLPYGGVVQGAERLKRMFTAAVSADAPAGAANLTLVRVAEMATGGEDHVVAELEFDWFAGGSAQPVRTGALEWWLFRDMRVVELKSFYRDTAALVGSAPTEPR